MQDEPVKFLKRTKANRSVPTAYGGSRKSTPATRESTDAGHDPVTLTEPGPLTGVRHVTNDPDYEN